jgi:nucleoside-triphosphatase
VDLAELERVAVPALQGSGDVAVIDELGKMELASAALREAVAALLRRPVAVVATVHAFAHPFTDALKGRPGVEVIRVDPANRDRLPELLAVRVRG